MVYHSALKMINFYTGLKQKNTLYNIGYPDGKVFSKRFNDIVIYIVAIVNIIYVLLALAGILFYSGRTVLKESLILLTVIIYFSIIHSVSAAFLRYSVPIFPYIIIIAGYMISRVYYKRYIHNEN